MGNACGATRPAASEPTTSPTTFPAGRPSDNPTVSPSRRGLFSRAQLIPDNSGTGRIQDVFTMDGWKLGKGAYGSVCRGVHRDTGATRAIKTIAKTSASRVKQFRKEIANLKVMDHPSIIRLYETYEDHQNIYLVMELCLGGTLFDSIVDAGHFGEMEAAVVMQQILGAVLYMHQNRYCHRDLKPENFVFQSKSSILKNVLKLIDFGLSTELLEGQAMSTMCGTPAFVAPEVLASRYDHMCDNWSVGAIMYTLLSGSPPFNGRNDQEVLSNVLKGKLTFDPMDWKGISEDAKNLIRSLMTVDPKARFTAEQALNDRWILRTAPRATDVPLDRSFVDKLRAFRRRNRFAKAALHVMAGQLSEVQIKSLRATFISLNRNGDGLLTLGELGEGLQRAGLAVLPSDLKEIFDGIDVDGSGVIDYTEFLAGTLGSGHLVQANACWSSFRVFDLNGDGRISADELRKVLDPAGAGDVVDVQSFCDVLNEVDKNGDGAIDFDEFNAMILGEEGGRRTATVPRT